MIKNSIITLFLILALAANALEVSGQADEKKSEVGVDEKLGQNIPLNISLLDEYGKPVRLGEMTGGKPIVLSLVYYRCPGICSPLLTGLTKVVDLTDLVPGKDFEIITVSFDPTETYQTAGEKKKNYFAQFKHKKLENADWRFLTADSATIALLTDAVGFRYIRHENEFVHSAVVTLISPDGKITRYLHGTDFLPMDFKLGVMEASEGKVGTTISKIVKLCYSYDPEGKTYVLNVTRIAGAGMILLLGIFVVVFLVKKKKN